MSTEGSCRVLQKLKYKEAGGVRGTCQYLFTKSNLLTYRAEPRFSTQSSICGTGKQSGTVTTFTLG